MEMLENVAYFLSDEIYSLWFLCHPVLFRSKTSQRLISHDIHSNTFNYKSTYSIEIVPVCKVYSIFLKNIDGQMLYMYLKGLNIG